MIERFKSGLFQPKKIAMYAKDKFYIVFLYVFLLSILCISATTIEMIKYNKMTVSEVKELKDAIEENKEVIPNISIIDYHLEESSLAGSFILPDGSIVAINKKAEFGINSISFLSDGVEFSYVGVKVATATYLELEIESIDFELLKDGDTTETGKIINIINIMIAQSKLIWGTFEVVTSFLMMIIFHIFFASLIALFFKFWNTVSYTEIFAISIYGLTPSLILTLFDQLFKIGFLTFGGGIIAAVYIGIAVNEANIKRVLK